jgi:glycosyltransferase involved in cell wall biosynthesis
MADRSRVRGWVQEPDRPYARIGVMLMVGDIIMARTIANHYRTELAQAGIGDGSHAFDLPIETLELPPEPTLLSIVREEDGAHLPGSPVLLPALARLDEPMQARITALLDTPCDDVELRRRIAFLTERANRLLNMRSDRLSRRREREAARHHAWRWGGVKREDLDIPTTPRALVVDDTTPVATRDAGSNAILSHMLSLQRLGYGVTLAPADMAACADPGPLDQMGVTVCHAPWYASVEEVLRRQPDAFDLVYLHRVAVAASYSGMVRRYQPRARLIYSVADLHHVRLQRQAAVQQRPELQMLARRIRAQELQAAWAADAVITHSTQEAAWLRQTLPQDRVHVVPWSVQVEPTPMPFEARGGVGFIGGFAHAPNVDAAFWLIDTLMPLVWAEAPEIGCFLAGSNMPGSLRMIDRHGVFALGEVADLATVFDQVRLTIAPLTYGAGVKGKVLASLAAGVPCACTAIAAEGIDLPALPRGNDARALAAIVLRLHSDADFNAACAAAGIGYVRSHLSDSRVDSALRAAIGKGYGWAEQEEEVAGFGAPAFEEALPGIRTVG